MIPEPPKIDKLAIVLRIVVFAFLAVAGVFFFPRLLNLAPNMYLVASALGVFTAAAVANALCLRMYENGQLTDIGLGWTAASRKNLLIGFLGGAGAAVASILIPVALQAGTIEKAQGEGFQPGAVLFVTVVLLFGAIGEEMLFRGYAFQLLMGLMGPFATILPFGILFAVAHLGNPGQGSPIVGFVAPVNTALWGFVLGYAFTRSGDLWLPIGLHFGWNCLLPLLGGNVSGFTMGVTGIAFHSRVNDMWTGGEYGPEGGVFATLVILALAYCLHRAPVDRRTPALVRSAEAW